MILQLIKQWKENFLSSCKGDKNEKYIQYFTKGVISGEVIEACGSDGIKYIDGSLSLNNIKIDALNNYRKYKHYEVRQGDFKHYNVLYRNF